MPTTGGTIRRFAPLVRRGGWKTIELSDRIEIHEAGLWRAGGRKKFINSVRLISHQVNIGDAKSLIVHPASTTHQQLSSVEQRETGVTEDYLRLSVGLEDIEDIQADIDQALRHATC